MRYPQHKAHSWLPKQKTDHASWKFYVTGACNYKDPVSHRKLYALVLGGMDSRANMFGQMIIPEAGSSARIMDSGGSPCVSQRPSARLGGSGGYPCVSQCPSGTRWKEKAETMLSVLLLRRLQVLSPTLRKRNSSLNDTSGRQVGQEPDT